MALLIPAILSRDPEEIREKLAFLEKIPEITAVHLDFADGQFVPNETVRPKDLRDLRTRLELEAHLMTAHPQNYFHDLEHLGTSLVLIHYESFMQTAGVATALNNVKSLGLLAGLAINPSTEVLVFDDFITDLKVAMLMNIHPGFQGQPFLPESLERLEVLRKTHPEALIEVDGGVNLDNFETLIGHGADRLVVGSGIWHSPNPKKRIHEFLRKLK